MNPRRHITQAEIDELAEFAHTVVENRYSEYQKWTLVLKLIDELLEADVTIDQQHETLTQLHELVQEMAERIDMLDDNA